MSGNVPARRTPHARRAGPTARQQGERAPRRGSVKDVDRAMLMYAIRWLPYDGGPLDDTLVDFGLSQRDFLLRLRWLVTQHRANIHPRTVDELLYMCERRIAAAGQSRFCRTTVR
jgi:hypothetical protein